MAVTDVSICNSALIKLGADRISSLLEDNKRSILCNEQYPKIRDLVLRAHPWNFAIRRAELAQLVSTPEWGYDFQYQLPSDCLRVLDVDGNFSFKVEGRFLLTDEGAVKIKYVSEISDPGMYDPNFAEAVAIRLAAELSFPLVQSRELSETLMKAYQQILTEARSMDAQEGTPEELLVDDFINSRF